jgi:hypothetical protein
MNYYLSRLSLGAPMGIALTPDEFESIKEAREGMLMLTAIEDKFDLVIENFVALEQSLLECSLRSSVHIHASHAEVMGIRQVFNRHLINFLSTAYLYTGQVRHDLSRSIFDASLAKRFNVELSNQYDSCPAYRLMEALRNYAQHRSLPISGVAVNCTAEHRDPFRLRVSTAANLDVDHLAADGHFKKKVLRELRQLGKKDIDISPSIREYVHSLAVAHNWLRGETSQAGDQWKEVLDAALEKARHEYGGKAVALRIVDEQGQVLQIMHLGEMLHERLYLLKLKNIGLERLDISYVASEE